MIPVILQGGVVVLQGLRKGKIQVEQKVLIYGTGGAGPFAIQLAKHFGAFVKNLIEEEKVQNSYRIEDIYWNKLPRHIGMLKKDKKQGMY